LILPELEPGTAGIRVQKPAVSSDHAIELPMSDFGEGFSFREELARFFVIFRG
jgi:hypothetical protein